MKRRKKYKFQSGIQYVTNDTPDYSEAYNIRDEENAKNKTIGNVAQQFSGAYAPIGQVGSMAGDVIRNRVGDKKKGAVIGGAVEMGAQGAALGAMLGGPVGAAIGGIGGALWGGISGSRNQAEVERKAKEAEEKARIENIKKSYRKGSVTDAQAALAKYGKYKVKTKEPRLIETEGREPIFSPKKADGTRDLLYYNPNDPTHEEGGVKAMVMPRKQQGTTKLEAGPVLKNAIKKYSKPMSSPKKQYIKDKDSLTEDLIELGDPTGISSYDDVYRSYKNTGLSPETGIEVLGALPAFGKFGKTIKGLKLGSDLFRESKLSKVLRFADKVSKLDQGKDIAEKEYNNGTSNLMPKRSKVSLLGSGNMAVGAKQLKVNTLNDAAFSSNLTGMPAVNAANKFVQPLAGIQQVARNIPEDRRQEKIRTPRSHKKVNPDTNRIIDPPMLYEMKPPPPRSTFNTKNDFNKGSKKVKVYR